MRQWLARLSYSFFIAAFLLFYQVYRVKHGLAPNPGQGQIVLYLVGALLAGVLGMMGIIERHKPRE